jgi:hypothetical protein
MTKPTGKLAFAYATIAKMEARIMELEAQVSMKDIGIDSRDALINEAYEIAYRELPESWISRATARLAHQPEPMEDEPLICDFCNIVTPDPWHGSGTFNGEDQHHIHACDKCRSKLPPVPTFTSAPAAKGESDE